MEEVEIEQDEEFLLPFLEAEDELLDKVRKSKDNRPWTHLLNMNLWLERRQTSWTDLTLNLIYSTTKLINN